MDLEASAKRGCDFCKMVSSSQTDVLGEEIISSDWIRLRRNGSRDTAHGSGIRWIDVTVSSAKVTEFLIFTTQRILLSLGSNGTRRSKHASKMIPWLLSFPAGPCYLTLLALWSL
jgi:hypothetical protein